MHEIQAELDYIVVARGLRTPTMVTHLKAEAVRARVKESRAVMWQRCQDKTLNGLNCFKPKSEKMTLTEHYHSTNEFEYHLFT
jgi:hypothetical protein